jgi:transcriptional regulator with XRE-family HTH domain
VTDSVFSDDYNRFREMLVQSRKDAGMTQVHVAESLSKPQSFVSKYERGERRLDVVEFIAVAKVLGIDPKRVVDDLAKEDG